MLKRVCDKCGGDKDVKPFLFPTPKPKAVYGQIESFCGHYVEDVDLCSACAEQLNKYLTEFKANDF